MFLGIKSRRAKQSPSFFMVKEPKFPNASFLLLNQVFADTEDIAGTHQENDITFPNNASEMLFRVFKRRLVRDLGRRVFALLDQGNQVL